MQDRHGCPDSTLRSPKGRSVIRAQIPSVKRLGGKDDRRFRTRGCAFGNVKVRASCMPYARLNVESVKTDGKCVWNLMMIVASLRLYATVRVCGWLSEMVKISANVRREIVVVG